MTFTFDCTKKKKKKKKNKKFYNQIRKCQSCYKAINVIVLMSGSVWCLHVFPELRISSHNSIRSSGLGMQFSLHISRYNLTTLEQHQRWPVRFMLLWLRKIIIDSKKNGLSFRLGGEEWGRCDMHECVCNFSRNFFSFSWERHLAYSTPALTRRLVSGCKGGIKICEAIGVGTGLAA